MTLNGTMAMNGSMKLEGPIQMQISGPSVTYAGTYVSAGLFDRIKLGSTKGEWLVAVLGEPQARTALSDGTELWRWSYQPLSEQASPLALWNAGGKDEPHVKQSLTFVQLRESVVIDKWRD